MDFLRLKKLTQLSWENHNECINICIIIKTSTCKDMKKLSEELDSVLKGDKTLRFFRHLPDDWQQSRLKNLNRVPYHESDMIIVDVLYFFYCFKKYFAFII